MKLFFDKSDQHISGADAPVCVLTAYSLLPIKRLIRRCCLIHFKKKFDYPAAFIQCGNRQFKQGRVVGQEYQRFSGFRVPESDASQLLGIILRVVETVEHDALIADNAGTSIGIHRIHSVCVNSPFAASYEERTPRSIT